MRVTCNTCLGRGYTDQADYCPNCGGWGYYTENQTNKTEKHTMEDKTTPKSLLEIGDQYVQATWHHPDANTEIIAIYRKKGDGKWVMDQPLRGPWAVYKDGGVRNNYSISNEAFNDVSVHAMGLFSALQDDGIVLVKDEWVRAGGTVNDL